MSAGLKNLYRDMILDHGRAPRNFGKFSPCDRMAKKNNPLCGDKIQVMVNIDREQCIAKIQFTAQGCAIALASGSIMSEIVTGVDCAKAEKISAKAIAISRHGKRVENALDPQLQILGGIHAYPARVRCATLAWEALRDALASEGSKN